MCTLTLSWLLPLEGFARAQGHPGRLCATREGGEACCQQPLVRRFEQERWGETCEYGDTNGYR